MLGGKRTLKLPPEFGYGSRGAGCKGGKYSFSSSKQYLLICHHYKIIVHVKIKFDNFGYFALCWSGSYKDHVGLLSSVGANRPL